ncbi:hypothetical protein ZEAMMB73_Zm00001d030227 [Zea mays]|uniref:Uncharacterized protein n=1 Tax=Zea mays TaxID=4577 RepID=A0A1D6KB10_MAIZE|nr:hypothetical protein ZEAMMB73_Zm00001d030227 [Zea mays]
MVVRELTGGDSN